MKNTYLIRIKNEGYIRTKNNISGYVSFYEELIIKANSHVNAIKLAKKESIGKTKETFSSKEIEIDFDNDEIIRDDTEELIEVELIYFSYKNYIKYFNDNFIFILNISNKDKKEIRKSYYKNKIYEINEERLNKDIWNYLDRKYFLPNKIRFNVKELNLNQITPETYFKKTMIIPELTFYLNKFKNNISNVIAFLNDIINKKEIYLIEREIEHTISNNKLKRIEKNKENNKKAKIEELIKINKNKFIQELKNQLKENGFEDIGFYLNIKIKEKK